MEIDKKITRRTSRLQNPLILERFESLKPLKDNKLIRSIQKRERSIDKPNRLVFSSLEDSYINILESIKQKEEENINNSRILILDAKNEQKKQKPRPSLIRMKKTSDLNSMLRNSKLDLLIQPSEKNGLLLESLDSLENLAGSLPYIQDSAKKTSSMSLPILNKISTIIGLPSATNICKISPERGVGVTVNSYKGRTRKHNEDRIDVILNAETMFPRLRRKGIQNAHGFAIFDGHGGNSCSEYLKTYFLKSIFSQIELNNINESIRRTCQTLEKDIESNGSIRGIDEYCGSCVVALIMIGINQL